MSAPLHPGTLRQRGVAALEFVLVLIPLLVILTGITEYGRAMFYYNTIAKAARDAARLMSTQTPTDPDYGGLLVNARCTAVHGNPACDGPPLLPGLTIDMVTFCDRTSCPADHENVPTGTGVINLVTVTIGPYPFTSMASFAPAIFGVDSFNFTPIRVTMRQIL
jgi:Flp pilus assembly protein TadG